MIINYRTVLQPDGTLKQKQDNYSTAAEIVNEYELLFY